MNTKNIAITTGVIASVVGLGFLSYFLFSKKEIAIAENNEQVDPSHPVSPSEKTIEAIHVGEDEKAGSFEDPIEVLETAIDISATITEKQGIIEEESSLKSEVLNDEFPLQLGSKGKRVERLQVWLLRNYGYSGKLTCEFDQKTLKLIQKHLKTEQIDEQLYNKLKMDKRVYEQVKKL